MFGISRFWVRIAVVIVVGIVAVCCVTLIGCSPETGSEFGLSQLALVSKNNIDSSKHQRSEDNSIVLNVKDGGNPLGQDFEDGALVATPRDKEEAESVATVVEARASERERVILAQAELKEKVIRAEEEKWRLLVWVVGIGAVILSALALLIKSPIDSTKRKSDE